MGKIAQINRPCKLGPQVINKIILPALRSFSDGGLRGLIDILGTLAKDPASS
jgi:hypothetical protein